MTGDRERALEAGCDDYDIKPVEWPQLLEKVQALLARGKITDSDGAAPSDLR